MPNYCTRCSSVDSNDGCSDRDEYRCYVSKFCSHARDAKSVTVTHQYVTCVESGATKFAFEKLFEALVLFLF